MVTPRLNLPATSLTVLVLFFLGGCATARADEQGCSANRNAIGDALLALWNGSLSGDGSQRVISGRLFAATVNAKIFKKSCGDRTMGPDDEIRFFKIERRGVAPLCFPNSTCSDGSARRDTFTTWVTQNKTQLLGYLFPTSISESASGKDAAQNHAQQFLLTTALGIASAKERGQPRRSETGGLFEFEQLAGDGRSGLAWQGMYRMEGVHMSILGRYAQQNENESNLSSIPVKATSTRSFTIATDYHPSIAINPSLDWRVGVDARTGLLFSRASALDLGSLDVGGGVWTSARKDFARVRIGLGGIVQGSKSYIPSALVSEELKFLADAFNSRSLEWDASYGAVGGFALTKQMSLNGKFLQTLPVDRAGVGRPTTTMVMGSISYLVGGLTPVDVGYKISNIGEITSHSIFVQGYFGW